MKNAEVRNAIYESGVTFWRVAEKLGIADTTFSRKLRHELSEEEKQKVLTAIEMIAKERA